MENGKSKLFKSQRVRVFVFLVVLLIINWCADLHKWIGIARRVSKGFSQGTSYLHEC